MLKLAASPVGNRSVGLFWANNTGYKNDLFFIERSTDGRYFEAIGVYDWTGRPMQHFQLDEVTVPDFQIDLSGLKPGTYTMVVTPAERRPSTKKLIISK